MADLYAQILCRLPRDPKMIAAGPMGRLAYIQFVLYARENLLDGRVSVLEVAFALTDIPSARKHLDRLVALGALEVTEDGWRVPERVWTKRNPLKIDVESKAAFKKAAGAIGNHERWHVKKNEFDPKCEHCLANRSQSATTLIAECEDGAKRVRSLRSESESESERHSESESDKDLSSLVTQTSQTPRPEATEGNDPLVSRLKAIAYRYAEIKLAEKRDGEISNPAAFKNARYAEALEMKACAKYAREYTLGCPVDVLAQALAGNNYSLRYQEEHRVAS